MSAPDLETTHPEPAHVTVAIGLKDWIGSPPSRVWIETFLLPVADVRSVQDQVTALLEADALLPGPLYTTWERKGRTSWGAESGLVVTVVLYLSTAVSGAIVSRLVGDLYDKLRGQQRATGRDANEDWREPLTRGDAIAQARWLVAIRFTDVADTFDPLPQSEDDLALESESYDATSDTWTIGLRDSGGANYRVTLGRVAGIPTTTQVQRTTPPQDS